MVACLKFILVSIWLLLFSLIAVAQISDDEARRLYENAEQQYEAQNFYECYQLCVELNEKMGKYTPKTQFLMLKAIYNNLESKNERSLKKINKSYENYSRFYEYSTAFFSIVDKKNYPEQKLKEVERIHTYFQEGMTAYEHQKGRKPEGAVAFLNECARKFPFKKEDQNKRIISRSVRFSLLGHYLRVVDEYGLVYFSSYSGKWEDVVTTWVVVTFIDFSRVTGVINDAYQVGNCIACTSWGFSGNNDKVEIIPVEGGEKKRLTTKGIVTSMRSGWKDKKRMSNGYEYLYSDTSTAPDLAFATWETKEYEIKTSRKTDNGNTNFYFLTTPNEAVKGTLFDQTSAEFREGGYEKRIIEAFQFLIDYFPKRSKSGTSENKNEIKSKF